VLATLEENKKKPVKKSKWQQRLESAAKQRGISPAKK
jgi:YidC/Oxa1 family membrane protein insertase